MGWYIIELAALKVSVRLSGITSSCKQHYLDFSDMFVQCATEKGNSILNLT